MLPEPNPAATPEAPTPDTPAPDTPAPAAPDAPAPDTPTPSAPGLPESAPRWSAAWFRRPQLVWPVLMAIVIVAYVWHFTRLTLDIHHGLGTASYDLGLYDQGLWLMSRFEAPFVTMMGRNLMGDHTSFILIFLVPLYWLWPGVGVLLFTQSAAIGAAAIPVYLYARRRLGSGWMALLAGCVFLLHPAVSWTNMENYHPDGYVALFVGLALYGALERRWAIYTVFVVLALMVKEDVSLVVVPLGIWVALRRDRRIGLLTIVGSLAFMALAMFVVMRSLMGVATRNTWRIPFGGPGGFVKESLVRPWNVVRHMLSEERSWYLWQMTAPLAYVWLRLPDVALISALVICTNVISTYFYQYSIMYHYSLIAVPALVIGTVYAIGAVRAAWRPALLAVVTATSLVTAYLWSPLPFSRIVIPYWGGAHPIAQGLRDIITLIPDDASVSAYYSAAPHVSHRTEIYQFPTPFRAVLYGVEFEMENHRLQARADGVDFILLPLALEDDQARDLAAVLPAFDLVTTSTGWQLWQRNRAVPLPEPTIPVLP